MDKTEDADITAEVTQKAKSTKKSEVDKDLSMSFWIGLCHVWKMGLNLFNAEFYIRCLA